MADKSDDLVIGVSTDMSSVQRALKKLDGDISRTGSQIERRFSTIGKGIDAAMSPVQSSINKMVGIGTKSTNEWTGALANQGKEMTNLRAKFSPLFATINNYKSSINEIRAAHRLGAISSDEMTAAITRERQAALSSIAAIKNRNAALADTPAVMGLSKGVSSFNTANIAAQFQDIAVMTQMGIANPLTIALQQGTQLSAVFNQMGNTRDVIRGIGAAFLQIVNPISLVTIGTIAAGVAAYNYFNEAEDGAATTAKALKEQEDLIQRVAQKWGDALPAVRAYADEQDRISGRADAETTFAKLSKDAFREIGIEVSSAGDAIEDVMDLLRNTVPPEQIVAIQRAFGVLTKTAAENKTSVDDMDAAHKALMDAFRSEEIPVLKAAADAIAELTPRLASVNAEMARLAEEKSLNLLLEDLQAKIGAIDSSKAREELKSLLERTREGDIAVGELQTALARISGYAPDVSGIIGAFLGVAQAAQQARDAASTFTGKPSQGGRVRYGQVDLPDNVSVTPTLRVDPYFDGPAKKAKSKGGGRGQRDANAYRDLVKSAQDRIDQMRLEAELVGKTGVAADAYRMKLELIQKATDKGRKLSPEHRAELEKLAETYGKVALQVAALGMQEELLFERQQMFRSSTEQRVHAQLRNAGIDPGSATGEFLAGQIRLNEQLALGKELASDFAGGFVDDLLNGVSAMDALANAAQRLGTKLLDMAMDQGINALLGNLAGALGGSFTPTTMAGAFFGASGIPGFATGTANTGGQRGQPMGIVHGQEAVIPLPNGGRVPVQIQTPQMPSLAPKAAGGGAQHVTISVDVSGARGNAEITEMVQQGVSRGLKEFPRTDGFRAGVQSSVKGLQNSRGLR